MSPNDQRGSFDGPIVHLHPYLEGRSAHDYILFVETNFKWR